MAVYEYGDVILLFEVRGLVRKSEETPANPLSRFKVLNECYTDEGMITNGHFYPKTGGRPEPLERFDVKLTDGGAWGGFLHAVRTGNVADCNADVELGHLSCCLVHAANASYRLGTVVPFREQSQSLGDNREVVASFRNITENLTAAGIRLDESEYRLGRTLTVDPGAERFVGDGAHEANAFLTREYRPPFVVPEAV
jgi:hypothetical protein